MITTEELYIILEEERHKVDLSTPSSITLSYQSNLFNSLDKVSCSRSYTITLPKTMNNTRIFGYAQDIRTKGGVIKMGCEYYVDGVSMFKNGNAYLSGVKDGYQIVVTWDVINSFQKISKDNFNINQFDSKENVETGMVKEKTYDEFVKNYQAAFDNLEPTYKPFYICGYDNVFSVAIGGKRNPATKLYPLPVVPVPYLIKRIEDYYDVRLNIYSQQSSDGSSLEHSALTNEVIDFGVIPCISTKVKYEQNEKNVVKLSKIYYIDNGDMTPDTLADDGKRAIFFDVAEHQGTVINRRDWGSGDANNVILQKLGLFELSGNLKKNKEDVSFGWKSTGSKDINIRGMLRFWFDRTLLYDDDANVVPPVLDFYQRNGVYGKAPDSIASITGVKNVDLSITEGRNHYDCFEFIMNPADGGSYASCGDTNDFYVYPVLSQKAYKWDDTVSYIELVPDWKEGDNAHEQDIISNLPEVSIMDFLKGLFFMVGGYPMSNKKGEVVIGYYNDIRRSVQYAVDWSKRIIDGTDDEITYKIGDFKAKNWYLMANDDIDKKTSPFDDPNEQKDVYESGLGLIEASSVDENEKTTVVKLPWNGAFIKDGKNPRAVTGNTLKYWSQKFGEKEIEADEAKPMYGVLKFDELPFMVGSRYEEYTRPSGIVMETWNGFKDIKENDGYKWLSEILKEPKVLKTKVLLTPYDLASMDMMVPVYIEKYNSYFCIIKIERSSNGECSAELLKIPSSTL